MKYALIVLYLAAIVAANLITTEFGPEASIYNAFFLIGFDLVTRDALHEFWGERRLPKMMGLIAAGSVLSYWINRDAAQVALASSVAFGAAALVDYGVYTAARRLAWLERSNLSNLFAAAVDSLLFPWIAFNGILWSITFGQFTAKVAGGVLFSILLGRFRGKLAVQE